ncbi:MAG: cytochrome c, partial [Bdellovibrionota bacterium]|nr:cytochrome c [Bdellovibrionota bacterium]
RIAINDIYMRLLAGAGGAAMPSWKDVIEDNEIWALAYYVRYLQGFKKDQAKRKAFINSIEKNK